MRHESVHKKEVVCTKVLTKMLTKVSTKLPTKVPTTVPRRRPRRLGWMHVAREPAFPPAGVIASLLYKVCSSVHVHNAIEKTKVKQI